MPLVTRNVVIATALTAALAAAGLVLVAAGPTPANAGPPPAAPIECDSLGCIKCERGACKECKGDVCTACDQWGCGSNTAEIQGKPFGALHLGGQQNSAGFKIEPVLRKGAREYNLLVEKGEFIGEDRHGRIAGKQLEGGWFTLRSAAPIDGRAQWRVEIETVALVPFFAVRPPSNGGQASATSPEYAFAYALRLPDFKDTRKYVCPETSAWGHETHRGEDEVDLKDGGLHDGTYQVVPWQRPYFFSVLVRGETYDANKATVALQGEPAKPWFNIACAGTALAKMKLMGYDPEDTKYPTTPGQRQTTLKMITARYCGSMSFTHPGQPLVWQNAGKWFRPENHVALPLEVGDVEALWDQNGAICLNEPRRKNVWTRDEVIAACEPSRPIPRCDDYFPARPVAGRPLPGVAGSKPPPVRVDPRYYVPAGKEWVTRHITSALRVQ